MQCRCMLLIPLSSYDNNDLPVLATVVGHDDASDSQQG